MDKFEDLKQYLSIRFFPKSRREQIDALFEEYELLKIDNQYLQQRLKREIEK